MLALIKLGKVVYTPSQLLAKLAASPGRRVAPPSRPRQRPAEPYQLRKQVDPDTPGYAEATTGDGRVIRMEGTQRNGMRYSIDGQTVGSDGRDLQKALGNKSVFTGEPYTDPRDAEAIKNNPELADWAREHVGWQRDPGLYNTFDMMRRRMANRQTNVDINERKRVAGLGGKENAEAVAEAQKAHGALLSAQEQLKHVQSPEYEREALERIKKDWQAQQGLSNAGDAPAPITGTREAPGALKEPPPSADHGFEPNSSGWIAEHVGPSASGAAMADSWTFPRGINNGAVLAPEEAQRMGQTGRANDAMPKGVPAGTVFERGSDGQFRVVQRPPDAATASSDGSQRDVRMPEPDMRTLRGEPSGRPIPMPALGWKPPVPPVASPPIPAASTVPPVRMPTINPIAAPAATAEAPPDVTPDVMRGIARKLPFGPDSFTTDPIGMDDIRRSMSMATALLPNGMRFTRGYDRQGGMAQALTNEPTHMVGALGGGVGGQSSLPIPTHSPYAPAPAPNPAAANAIGGLPGAGIASQWRSSITGGGGMGQPPKANFLPWLRTGLMPFARQWLTGMLGQRGNPVMSRPSAMQPQNLFGTSPLAKTLFPNIMGAK